MLKPGTTTLMNLKRESMNPAWKVKSPLNSCLCTETHWKFKNPVILELGVDKGLSTTVFLQACRMKNGNLVSVDIRDCSEISDSKYWTFVQSDSTDVDNILSKAPFLKEGIDVIYIDSLHNKDHVKKELNSWYPYMKKGHGSSLITWIPTRTEKETEKTI